MDLLEYQGKQLFKEHGVPVPEGRAAATVPEAVEAAEELGYPVVIKAQVLIGGRGKAGGIKLANDRAEAEQHAEANLRMDIRGFNIHELDVAGPKQSSTPRRSSAWTSAASPSTSCMSSARRRSTRSTTRRSSSTAARARR